MMMPVFVFSNITELTALKSNKRPSYRKGHFGVIGWHNDDN